MDFSQALTEIARRLEGYDENAFFVDFAYYNPEKKEWTLKIHQKKKEAANESDQQA